MVSTAETLDTCKAKCPDDVFSLLHSGSVTRSVTLCDDGMYNLNLLLFGFFEFVDRDCQIIVSSHAPTRVSSPQVLVPASVGAAISSVVFVSLGVLSSQ